MKVTEFNFDNVRVTIHDPQSEKQREILEKSCIEFIKKVEADYEKKRDKNYCNKFINK